ncbi:MAG: di-trans,poly-cis-decaprenylcistransferase [Candidatus Magasanikbacteria bacterium]|jgi:undecaprenyl diphosphate synthase|nr:di-trans,poly-cis-decaprenylcistransferase [Candidatus Magasanikbacteria bacterium]
MTEPHPLTHLAIILDGNRRWAKSQGLPSLIGHTEGAKNIRPILEAAVDHNISFVTLYVLSTENLKERSESELSHLFLLFAKLIDYLELFTKNNARLMVVGDLSKLPAKVQETMQKVIDETKHNTGMTITLALNYGGRDEITRAVQRIVQEQIPAASIDESVMTSHLDSAHLPDVDLMIRTGGDQRLSNYLLWKNAYAELYFTPVQWPAFRAKDLDTAIEWFYTQKRNRGK